MSKMKVHIAFEAARMLEIVPEFGLAEGECYIDPVVDDEQKPYVLISVENEHFEHVAARVPESVVVMNQMVGVVVRPLTMRMC